MPGNAPSSTAALFRGAFARPLVDLTRGDLLKQLEEARTPREVEVTTPGRGIFTSTRGGTGSATEVRKYPFDGVRDHVLSTPETTAVWNAACHLG
ncbi:hypothetical protein [Falsiroseomonas sp.]|uniref:hypothetical protein n=1 Tax=Falsiroseomonas sp. TaxID=2870721 RepID=UPI0027337958|nr:hypothetical protein [Falsiroseomonas sp.]MDP3418682.1 hypothetical protein [Falsiroseomonas sp.]